MHTKPILASLFVGSLLVGSMLIGSTVASAKTIRGHKVHSGGHSSYYGGGYYGGGYYGGGYYGRGYYGRGYYGGVSFAYGYSPYYAYPYYPWYPAYVGYGPRYVTAIGYVDTDVSPEKASVFLDGVYVGTADNFDGFPRHLSAEPGSHVIKFEYDGYRTMTRKIRIPRGAIVKMDFKMIKGDGEDSRSFIADPEIEPQPEPQAEDADLEWEDAAGPGFVRLRITPDDASVYLDGEFYAPASTLMGLHGKLRIESGRHVIEVVKPGYAPGRRQIEIAPGDRITVTIDLVKEAVR